MLINVKNIKGSSDNDPPYGYNSWLDWWESQEHCHAYTCSNIHCNGNAEVGGHVIRTDIESNKWYIVPLCKKCNNSNNTEQYTVDENKLARLN